LTPGTVVDHDATSGDNRGSPYIPDVLNIATNHFRPILCAHHPRQKISDVSSTFKDDIRGNNGISPCQLAARGPPSGQRWPIYPQRIVARRLLLMRLTSFTK
jgi:hypothetical protein